MHEKLTKASEIGNAMGDKTTSTKYTNGVKEPAIRSWFGPVRIAAGTISPTIRTIDTDNTIASLWARWERRNKQSLSTGIYWYQ